MLTRQNIKAILNLNKKPDRRNRGIGIFIFRKLLTAHTKNFVRNSGRAER
jgi:hypothetical protein